jgi:energy-coupling factor transporter ATP-binding protein EcfA2
MRLSISGSIPKLEVRGLKLRFADSGRELFGGLDFTLDSGELLVISGGNASGKSSLIHCLCGIIPKNIAGEADGEIFWGAKSLRDIPLAEVFRFMSVAPADAKEQMLLPTVELEIAFALENMGLDSGEIERRISASASRFGLSDLLQAAPQKLSGGEQRLLLFAICDSMQNPVLLMDEPETGLSDASLDLLCAWLQELREQGRAIILATHHPRLMQLADKQIKLELSDV